MLTLCIWVDLMGSQCVFEPAYIVWRCFTYSAFQLSQNNMICNQG